MLPRRDILGKFIKGHTPWNKGLKNVCKPNRTSFRIGHKFPREIEKKRLQKSALKSTINPNLNMDVNLAYILGLIKGDGFVSINKLSNVRYVCFDSVDEQLAMNFANSLKKIGLNPRTYQIEPYNGISKKIRYRVIAYSKKFYEWYKQLSLSKIEMLLDNKEKKIAFLKGFYEAEGSLFKYGGKLHLAIWNTNKKLLILCKHLLDDCDIEFSLNGPYPSLGFGRKLRYNLNTASQLKVMNFINLIKPLKKGF